MVGVIAYRVTTATYLLEELGVASHIVRHAEERGLDPQLIELIQYPRRDLGYRTIIEGKVDTLALECGDTPARSRHEHAVPHGYPTEDALDHRRKSGLLSYAQTAEQCCDLLLIAGERLRVVVLSEVESVRNSRISLLQLTVE